MDCGRIFFDRSVQGGNMYFNGDSVFGGVRSVVMNLDEMSKKRPLFGSSEEFYDEEYYDEQLPEKKRRLTSQQVYMLEKSFEADNKLEPERKSQLANELGLQHRQVAVWFQNRRARWKNKQLEKDYDQLKSSYDSLLSNYDSILKENDNLKAELITLKEKLQRKEPGGEPSVCLAAPPGLDLTVKIEDGLSDGSGVVDEDSPHFLDSGDSYFEYPANQVVDLQSEINGRDNGGSLFPDVYPAAVEDQQEPHGWFIWS